MKPSLLLLFLCSFCYGFSQIPVSERAALMDFHKATDGANWKTPWDMDKPISEWYGVTIEKGHVSGLALPNNHLRGKLPSTLVHCPTWST